VTAALDHLVVAAATLDDGVAWCEATLGVVPDGGGRHALMGTHNRLLATGGDAFPQSYLEIIAVDPDAPAPVRVRWFGLDDPWLQQRLRRHGPQLVHWVARTDALDARRAALARLGVDPGAIVAAQRGTLRWRITLRDDARRFAAGAWPLWIEWDGAHPTATLPARGVALRAFAVGGVPLSAADALDVPGVTVHERGAPLLAVLETPRGVVELTGGA
jgi:hypothetical protein